ncbi:molybdate ABC transporter substrate-binding protein|uniref:Molybdate transport system substrate-binding protein n=1 Tax=Dendrosporobacter quercicolus TaxID=146817 RepID=A0A1G9RKC6_9FIRM|nr:molybdate ABC transporter substrate-binding protein [Dendrosporobacter quercicolus]NSL49422.1 molybdate ABC transporter substrate-binding protein [Dendrosporobacter quercicolus DSM 1736]SDM23716.1 molybdate transport system substrate-binding protein [Dendrosporobacter quercicolus]
MKLSKLMLLFLVLAVSMALVAGCSGTKQPAPAAAQPVELNIAAAASLKDAMGEIQKLYTAKKPEVTLVYNFASSGALQKQIEQGAPADLFISAAAKQMDELEGKNLIKKETRNNLVENSLVIIVPKDSQLNLSKYEDLTQTAVKKVGIGETETVPAGQYAQEVLKKLALWDTIKAKAVMAKDVRTVLTYVETGNVDAGIVYGTDAAVSEKVKVVATAPAGSHQPIVYPVAVLTGAKQPQAADEFLAFLNGSEAKAVFEKYGFTVSK